MHFYQNSILKIGKSNIGIREANICICYTTAPVRWWNIFRSEFKAQIIMLKLFWSTVLLFLFTMRLKQTHISNYTEIEKSIHRYLEVVQFQFRLPSQLLTSTQKKWNHPIRINISYGRIIFPKTTLADTLIVIVVITFVEYYFAPTCLDN